jgi:uncharacterized repeat protein (TIGR03803 family)
MHNTRSFDCFPRLYLHRWRLVVVGLTLSLTALLACPARAQTYTILYSFKGAPDGAYPYAGVVTDRSGNLFGITETGGHYQTGTVFKIDSSGTETVQHAFVKAEGGGSMSALLLDREGNLYGTNPIGGGLAPVGTVFELSRGGKLAPLYRFGGGLADGNSPYGALIRDDAEDLYGATSGGGAFLSGTIFKIDHQTGAETILYNFQGQPDGAGPNGGLVRDAQGNLYGTTILGGVNGNPGFGTVFKLDAAGNETVLYSFEGGSDGEQPGAGLIRDSAGNFYGTTIIGGGGSGTVFKLDPSSGETVLHRFGSSSTDGIQPHAGVVRDAAGNFYGTTYFGGAFGDGTVYKLDPGGNLTILHSFAWGTDGAGPWGGVIRDAAGNLYGTTSVGGTYNFGIVYKITP